jgi:hypothetical protein
MKFAIIEGGGMAGQFILSFLNLEGGGANSKKTK